MENGSRPGWGRGLAESVLTAFALGAVTGILALGLETLWGGRSFSLGSTVGYTLLGGTVSATARYVLGRLLGVNAARLGSVTSLAAFASRHGIYFVNVKVLPLDDMRSPRSVALDAAVVALALFLGAAAVHSKRMRRARDRWSHSLAAFGLAVLLGSLGALTWFWPRDAPGPVSRGDGPNLVLVIVDSARRDHLGLHGYSRPTSPSLDAVAPSARVFDAAFSTSSWTVPSVRFLLRSGLPSASPTLVDELAAKGYVTACFSDNPNLSPTAPLLAGFNHVGRSVGRWRVLFAGTVLGDAVERLDPGDDRRLVDRALGWAAQTPGPFLLYVHLMDAHAPFRHAPIDGKQRGGRHIVFPASTQGLTPDEVEDVIARYDAGIQSADRGAGRLLEAASAWGRPYLAIVTADHGESLGESGRWFHGGSLAPELLAVPLVVTGAGVRAGRVGGPVGHTAVTSTLLAAARGIPPGVLVDDLRSASGGGEVTGSLPPNLAYRIAEGYKVILRRSDGYRRLFDLKADPAERHDISGQFPERAEILSVGLDPMSPVSAPHPDLHERLRSLGYVDAR